MQQAAEWLGGYIWLTAFVLGALHALQPGHGKTIVAAYLVGSRGTVRDAVLLGVVVTLTHTMTIYLLAGLAQAGALLMPVTELEQYLGAVAASLILLVGLALIWSQWRRRGHHHSHGGQHDQHPGHGGEQDQHNHRNGGEHGHGHHHAQGGAHGSGRAQGAGGEHEHSHGVHHGVPRGVPHAAHEHAHLPGLRHSHADPKRMTSLSAVFMLGISGGIVPCPEGLAVFLASLAGGQMEKGLLLVMVFSLGLAATLVAVGIIFIKASSLLRHRADAGQWGNRISWASALLVTLVGAIYLSRYLSALW